MQSQTPGPPGDEKVEKSSSCSQKCKQLYLTRALKAAAFFTLGLLLLTLETSFYLLALTILHLQFSCLVRTGTICLAHSAKITKIIFLLTVHLLAGGGSSVLNHVPLKLRESFLSTSRGSGSGPSHQVMYAFSFSSTAKTLQGLSQQDWVATGLGR